MKVTASVKNKLNTHEITLSSNDISKQIVIAPKANGYGSSVNGAELLLLALATCYCNDIYREAAKRRINVTAVDIEFEGEFGGDGEPGRNFRYKPIIQSDATTAQLEVLLIATDHIAEIHKTLRQGIAIELLR